MVPLVDAVYARVGDPAAAEALVTAAAGEDGNTVFIPITDGPAEGDWCQALS